jgi:hypothetical protein
VINDSGESISHRVSIHHISRSGVKCRAVFYFSGPSVVIIDFSTFCKYCKLSTTQAGAMESFILSIIEIDILNDRVTDYILQMKSNNANQIKLGKGI